MKQLINTFLKASSLFLVVAFVISSGCQQQSDYSKELKPILDKYLEVWRNNNVDELDALMDPNFLRHADSATSANGVEEMKKVIREFNASLSNMKLVSEEEIFIENKFAGRWSVTATHTSTGLSVTQWGNNIIHFKDGKIVEEWDGFDNLPFIEQLGFTMMPPINKKK